MLATMDPLTQVRRLLDAASDPDNPTAEELRRLLDDTQHVAVIGMSRDPTKAARRVPSYLAAKGYDVIPVNPNATRILGRPAYATLADVPDPIDIVVFFRPSHLVGPFIEEAMQRPTKPALWLQEGIRSDNEARIARASGYICVQNLCVFQVHRALEV